MVTNIEEKIPFNCIRSKSHRFNSCVVCQGNERPARLNEILWWNNAECTNQLPALKIIVVRIIHRCRVHTPSLRRTRMCKVHGNRKASDLARGRKLGSFSTECRMSFGVVSYGRPSPATFARPSHGRESKVLATPHGMARELLSTEQNLSCSGLAGAFFPSKQLRLPVACQLQHQICCWHSVCSCLSRSK